MGKIVRQFMSKRSTKYRTSISEFKNSEFFQIIFVPFGHGQCHIGFWHVQAMVNYLAFVPVDSLSDIFTQKCTETKELNIKKNSNSFCKAVLPY